MAIAIARRCLKGEGLVDDREDEEGLEDGEEEARGPGEKDHILDLQAGHGSHVAGMIYARGILEGDGEVASMRERYRMASEAWHRLLEFPSTLGGLMRKRTWQMDEPDRNFARWKRMRSVNVSGPLERILGPGAQFRGIQERVIGAIVRGESPIVSVMGTGAGKSLLFMLPAMCSAMDAGRDVPGMTVVVIPMVSLRQDMQRRCQAVGLSCAEWDCRRPQAEVSVMLVTSESAISHAFQSFVLRMRASHRLERIVIDECHTVLDSREDFRRKLRRLSELWVAECQIVMLTATLPPEDEGRFFEMMAMSRPMIEMFRGGTSRANVRYRVIRRDGGDDEEIQQVVREVLERYPEGKVIIYSTSAKRAEALAEVLSCEAYFRPVEEKRQVFERIVGRECRLVVATNALGLGIDIPDIRAVIHVDGPRSMRDFGQESGRAGRDGQVSESIVMAGGGESRHPEARMREFIDGGRCCRVILDEYLDGRTDRERCEEDTEQACERCQRDPPRAEEIEASPEERAAREEFRYQTRQREQLQEWVQQMRSDEALELEGFERRLQGWANRCPWCYTQGRVGASTEHALEQCPDPEGGEVRRGYEKMKAGIRYGKYCVCYECGVPQAICDRFEANGTGGWRWRREQTCQYPGVMIGAVIGMMVANINRCAEAVGEWMGREGVDKYDERQVYGWMGGKIRWGGMEAAMINKVFYRLTMAIG